jgi:hypothetical protein
MPSTSCSVLRDGALVAVTRGGRVEVVEGGRVVEEVDHAAKVRLLADRQLDWGDAGTEGGADLLEHAVEVGALAVELVDHDDAWQAELFGRPPGVEGLGGHPVGGAHDNHGQLDGRQRERHLVGEVRVAGRVEHVDPYPVDLDGRHREPDRELAGDLLGLEVTDRRAPLDGTGPGDRAGRGQEGLCQRGLAGTVVSDQGHGAHFGACGHAASSRLTAPWAADAKA